MSKNKKTSKRKRGGADRQRVTETHTEGASVTNPGIAGARVAMSGLKPKNTTSREQSFSDDGARNPLDSQEANSPVIAEIVQLWRMRQRWHRAEKSLILAGRSFCRSWTNGDKAEANKLFDAVASGKDDGIDPSVLIVLEPFVSGIRNFERLRKPLEKRLRLLARAVPMWKWAADIRGFGDLNFAGLVGEAGDIGSYRNPSCLWKRMGLAVIEGQRQRKVKDKDLALLHGYSPPRRAVAFLLGDCLIRAKSPFKKFYEDRKAYELARADEYAPSSPLHAHRRAARYMTKRVLRDLWIAWRQATLGLEPSNPVPAITSSAQADPPAIVGMQTRRGLPGETHSALEAERSAIPDPSPNAHVPSAPNPAKAGKRLANPTLTTMTTVPAATSSVNNIECIKQITFRASVEGAAETSAKLKRIQAAYERGARAFDRVFDAQRRFEAVERSQRR